MISDYFTLWDRRGPVDESAGKSKKKKLFKNKVSHNLKTILKRSLLPLLGALILYKLISLFLFVPIIKAFWALILRLSPVHFITNSTLFSVLKIPYVPAALMIIAIAAAFWAMFEYSIIIRGLDCAFNSKQIKLKALLRLAFHDIRHALRLQNLPILLYAAVLIPFANFFLSSNYISQLIVPEYIMEVIRKNGVYNAIYLIVFAFCLILAVLSVFIFHIFILENKSFAAAFTDSLSYIKKDAGLTLSVLIKKNIGIFIKVFIVSIIAFVVTLSALIFMNSYFANMTRSMGNAVTLIEIPILSYIAECVVTIEQFAVISAVFYVKRSAEPKPVPDGKRHFKIGSSLMVFITVAGSVLMTMLMGCALYYYAPDGVSIFGNKATTISYHRGYLSIAPENTIPAFEAAIEDGGDIAELDVQLTSDGVVVVFHDPTLKRIAGVNKRICDMSFEEVRKIDAGSFFSPKYAGTQIPTLDEVIKLCRGRIDLNIEIKQCKDSPELEKKTVEIIKNNDFINNCTVTSLSYESLDKVKQLEPEIKTGYILAIGAGNYYDLPSADFFSVEASFITAGMVSEIHLRGKTVSAWTINRSSDATRLIDLGVDDLITEEPHMVREAIAENVALGDYLADYLDLLTDSDSDGGEPDPVLSDPAYGEP